MLTRSWCHVQGDSMLAEAEDALQSGKFDLADELIGGAKMAYRMDGRGRRA